ncbi:hypothetical protein BaRGS_00011047 [Batillaria attramentaria]|uniref:Uncharacterized protein n=1 Tax=Batillaria attramentaria TaxID=370345 RepID=A0ABD0LF25_9CAEN
MIHITIVPVTEAAVDLASPAVFNYNFYISTNPEVVNAGIHDEAAAKHHWLQHGIGMGLQASGNFHSMQYLARYKDIRDSLGAHSYQQAVEHYLTNGIHEHRLGYVEGGFEGRWTVSDSKHQLHVSASNRMGAAVDSVVWNNKEFINAWDHGRELQMAMNFSPNGECFNPTEAGGRDDFQAATTHTVIKSVLAHGNTLETTVHPAFWLRPHAREAGHGNKVCHNGTLAMNTDPTYRHPFSKVVTLSCPGVTTPCITYESTFTIAGHIPDYTTLQMEAPTGYMTREFTKYQSVAPRTGHMTHLSNRLPLVMSTQDDHYAMGIYAPPDQDTDLYQYYGTFNFSHLRYPAASSNKWNVVYRKHTFASGSTHVQQYRAYICVGTVHDVQGCINSLLKTHENLIG